MSYPKIAEHAPAEIERATGELRAEYLQLLTLSDGDVDDEKVSSFAEVCIMLGHDAAKVRDDAGVLAEAARLQAVIAKRDDLEQKRQKAWEKYSQCKAPRDSPYCSTLEGEHDQLQRQISECDEAQRELNKLRSKHWELLGAEPPPVPDEPTPEQMHTLDGPGIGRPMAMPGY